MSELTEARERGEAEVRPQGAMTQAMRAVPASEGRVLRWALVRDGRIVSEAIVARDRALTIGAGADVPWSGRERTLAWHEGGRWFVRVSPAWSGRIGARTLGEAIAGRACGEDGSVAVALDDDGRARITLGEHALLLQVVAAPPRRQRAPLPAALTGGFLKQADWLFTAFVAASFLLHFAFVVGLFEADWPVETALIPSRYAEPIFLEREPPPDPPVEPMVAEVTETPSETPSTTPDAPPSPSRPTQRPSRRQPPRQTQAQSDQDAFADADRAVHMVLAGLRPAEHGALGDVLRNGAPTGDSASILEQADGTDIARNEAGIPDERPGSGCVDCGGDRSLGRLAASGGPNGPLHEGGAIEERIIRVTPDPVIPIDPPPPGWDLRELMRALRARMPAVQRCFEHEITTGNPDAGGRLTIGLTVVPVGSIEGLSAVENETGSAGLAACAIRSLRTTRVRTGPPEPVEVEFPIVFARRE